MLSTSISCAISTFDFYLADKNGMPIYRPKGGPHLKLIDEKSDIVAGMKDKAAIDMNQVKSK